MNIGKKVIFMLLLNAFSLQMLQEFPAEIFVEEVTPQYVAENVTASAVGHADTAAVLSSLLGKEIPCNRVNVSFTEGSVLVAQLQGGRLPEGATTLPEGFTFKFLKVTVD